MYNILDMTRMQRQTCAFSFQKMKSNGVANSFQTYFLQRFSEIFRVLPDEMS